jgi:hypothetical protein
MQNKCNTNVNQPLVKVNTIYYNSASFKKYQMLKKKGSSY